MTRYYNITRYNHRILSVSQQHIKLFHLTLFALIAILAGSCTKGVLDMGSDILPKSDFVSIKGTDTLSVFSYTMFDELIKTNNPSTSYLGQIYDPIFGTTDAGFVSQIRLSSEWNIEKLTVDSVKLFLHLLTTKGGGEHTLSFYEIADQIYTDSAYYSNTPVNLTDFKVTDIVLPALRTDTINDVTLTLPGNGIEFGNYLTRDPSKLFYSNKISDFRSYFKGLYFKIDAGSEPLLVSLSLIFNTVSYNNYFLLYGHDSDSASVTYPFFLDAKNANAAFNKYSHDFTTATLGDKMAHINTTYRDTLSYLQALNGVYTKVLLPGLEKIKNDPTLDKITINKARLVVPVKFDKTSNNQYYSGSLPSMLYIRYKANDGFRYLVPDYNVERTYHTFFDGQLDSVKNVYNFNIPAFVQAYLDGTIELENAKPELEIYQGTGILNTILKANNNKTPVKFEFTYTKF